jgi:senataxin
MKFGCTKVILVGDPEQLPATVTSKKAEDMYLFQSFFERIYQRFRHQESCNPIRMLSIQYRMHPEICRFPSQNFYRNKLITDKKLAEKRLQDCLLEPYLIFDITDSKEVCENVGE